MIRKTLLVIVCAIASFAQTRLDVERQGKGTGFLEAPFAKPVRVGEVLPQTCFVGELYFLSTAPAGGNLYVCHTPGGWAPQGSSGQASTTALNNGNLVGSRPVWNFIAGTGLLQAMSDTGTELRVEQAIDSAVVTTKASLQSGTALRCEASSQDGNGYACSMSPALEQYTDGMVVYWTPTLDNGPGGMTLDIDALGPRQVVLGDGLSAPDSATFHAGRMYPLWYDGARFRGFSALIPEEYLTEVEYQGGEALYCESTGTMGSDYRCSLSLALTHYKPGMLLRWKPDADSAGGPATLAIDDLAALPITLRDGVSNPGGEDIKAGQLQLLWYDGDRFRVVGESTAEFLRRDEYQSSRPLRCESVGTVGNGYACETNPPIAAYERGMVLHWIPDVDSAGGPTTLNVNGLGAVQLRLANGSMDPVEGDLRAGTMQAIWFDGAQFRIRDNPAGAIPDSDVPGCSDSSRGRLWFVRGAPGVKDELRVCAKTEDAQSSWRILF